ncbi:TPA: hypothetical protein NNT01_004504 [Salmonella enterica]|nr:hypothetical protein [Salmonella enterica]HCH9033750.1 hypothetical protein [Salmonella enterica]HCH9047132.1 hypothetical protein [Salmonella enterica]HCH9051559.1 hypothetical protein [Salmonella enterica]HCH9129444.1 hypothetical protein [Salmonella enterica]
MNILRSFTETVVTTPTDTFPISFEYDENYDAVHVFLNDVAVEDLGYTVSHVNAVTLKVEPAIPEGTVRIERETDIDKMKYIFDAGALFIDQNVDADFKQIVHSQQEVRDGFIKLRGDVLPLVHGLQEALQQAQEASEAAQEAANAAEEAAQTTRMAENVIDFTGKNQQEVNDGLESIAELLSITTVRTGLRIYVKSYHAGLGKGGGWFVYDATKANINNGVTIFNGWVRVKRLKLSVYDCGVKNSTDHNDYNDHDSLRKLAALLSEDTTTSYEVDFEDANLIVGKAVLNPNTALQASEMPFVVDFTNRLPNGAIAPKSIKIVADNARLTWRNGMKLGTFLRSTGERYDPVMPFYPNTASWVAQQNNVYVYPASFMMRFINLDHVQVAGKIYYDGNAGGFIKGGGYGDKDWQLGGYGLQIYKVNHYVVGGNIESNDQPSDGFYLACTATPTSFGIAKTLTALRNGRQAYSITGGHNLSFYDLLGMDSGVASLPFPSAPKSNLDLEGEVAEMRNVNFYNCRFINAGNESVVSASQDTRNVNFYDCNIEGEKSIWIDKPQFTFYGGTIKGAIQKLYGTNIDADRVRFFGVDFSDETVTNTGGWLIQAANGNPLFEHCRFKITKSAWFFNTYTAITGTPFKLRDCVIDFAHQITALSGVFEFEGLTIIDSRSDPSAVMSLNFASVYHDGIKIVSRTGTTGLTYSGGKLFEPVPNSKIAKMFVGNPTLASKVQAFEFVHRLGSSGAPTPDTIMKNIYADNITNITQNTLLYVVGDTVNCTAPVARNGIIKWVCTTGGYYNTNAWVASTAYAVNTYVNANGKVYRCTVAGTSGTSAPNHSSGTASNGSATFEYIGTLAVFRSSGSTVVGLTANSTAADIVAAMKAAGIAS